MSTTENGEVSARAEVKLLPPLHPEAGTLRDIIADDHFGGEMPLSIVDAWVVALQSGTGVHLPPDVKGFYGGDLRASMLIEIARGSYKFIAHETADRKKIQRYSERMLTVLSLVESEQVAEHDPTVALLSLWHKMLALVRLPEAADDLMRSFAQYAELRPQSPLSESKMPSAARLRDKLSRVAAEFNNTAAFEFFHTR